MTTFIRRATRLLARNLNPVEDGIHFHAGSAGPYVCDYAHCVSPQVAVDDR